MCLVEINFVVVRLKQKCLGLHWMCVNNGTKDNIVVDEVLVKGLGWEVYVAQWLHTNHSIEESHACQ